MPVVTKANKKAGIPIMNERKLRLDDQFTKRVVATDQAQLIGDSSSRLSIPAVPPAPWMSSPEENFASNDPIAVKGHNRIRQTKGRRGPSNPKSSRIDLPIYPKVRNKTPRSDVPSSILKEPSEKHSSAGRFLPPPNQKSDQPTLQDPYSEKLS